MQTAGIIRCGLLGAVMCAGLMGEEAAERRAAFLKLIDRPRIPAAPLVEESPLPDGLVQIKFSFASERDERVPGILIRRETAGRRPAVIALHGTGGNNEGQVELLKRLAAHGIAAVATDGRRHGRNRQQGTGSADSSAAGLRMHST